MAVDQVPRTCSSCPVYWSFVALPIAARGGTWNCSQLAATRAGDGCDGEISISQRTGGQTGGVVRLGLEKREHEG